MARTFVDREDAGRRLAKLVMKYKDQDPLVLALPRGGVPVAWPIARALDAPMDVLVARKIGMPGQPELGVGAIAEGGATSLNREMRGLSRSSDAEIDEVADREAEELKRRVETYRGKRELPEVKGRTVLLVDDGIATGGTMKASIKALKELEPAKLVVVVPVAPPDTLASIEEDVDEVICPERPDNLMAIGYWYQTFGQTSDAEVVELLEKAGRHVEEARGK
jgi:putative phosphoribosyl transferase